MFRGRWPMRAMRGGSGRFNNARGGHGGGYRERSEGSGRFQGADRGSWNRGQGFRGRNSSYGPGQFKEERNDVYDGGYRSEDQPTVKKEEPYSAPMDTPGFALASTGAERPERAPSKMGRIIIRNLPFSTKDEDLKNLMGKCGKILEVRIPVKEAAKEIREYAHKTAGYGKDGKMRGFAFVQFQSVNSAELAIKMFNATKVKERPIAVDWAVAKSRYEQAQAEQQTSVKMEADEKAHDSTSSIKNTDAFDAESEASADSKSFEERNASDQESQSGDSETEDANGQDEESDGEDDPDTPKKKKPRHEKKPSDVQEGRTLFVRNIPFDADADSFRQAFAMYGRVNYALLCHHADSGQPKGSGFVQFRDKQEADSCLARAASVEGMVLGSRKLGICLAENPKQRRKAERIKHEKVPKDNRNLALLNAGAVQKDDPQFSSMSQNDSRKRSMLDKRKAESLKNLHMFVSKTRLSIHNIPKNVDNQKLRQIIADASRLSIRSIQKCLIMRDMDHLDAQGTGKSRGFGFIDFRNHEDAAKALASVNNNPSVFQSDKRPIVEFALENRAVLLKKQRRLEHSQAKLQMLQKSAGSFNHSSQTKRPQISKTQNPQLEATERIANQSRPKVESAKVRPSNKTSTQKNLQRTAGRIQQEKSLEAQPYETTRRPEGTAASKKSGNKKRKKPETVEEADDFSRIVESYKKKLFDGEKRSGTKLSRWFDT